MKRALLLVAFLALAACEEKRPAAPPPGPNAQDVTFETDPPGAEIAIEGTFRGATPMTLKLDPGRYRVRISMSAYFPEEQVLTVAYGQPAKFQFSLIRSH